MALGFLYVYLYGVNVVVNDEWELAPLFKRLAVGRLSFLDLWEPHNEHRFFFPRLALLALGSLTRWNTIVEMYAIQFCLLATMTLLFLAFRRSVGGGILLFVPVAFLVFSLRQWENLLWGYQVTFAFAQTFSVLALYLLFVRGRGITAGRWALLAALASATVATGSAIQGLMVWPAGLLLIALSPTPGRRPAAVVWAAIGAVEWVVYFLGYEGGRASSALGLLVRPDQGFGYFLAILGNWPFLPSNPAFAFASGLLLALLAVIGLLLLVRAGKIQESSFWVALLAFSALTLASITVGRYEAGVQALLTSRYATFSLLGVVAVYALLAKLALEERSRVTTGLFGTIMTVVILSVPVSYYAGIKVGEATETQRLAASYVLRSYESQPIAALKIVRKSNTERVKKRGAPIIERLGYNVFAGSATRGGERDPRPPQIR